MPVWRRAGDIAFDGQPSVVADAAAVVGPAAGELAARHAAGQRQVTITEHLDDVAVGVRRREA